MEQVRSQFKLSYIPILDNYPEYANITKVPFPQELVTLVAGTMETGTYDFN